jgi:hypothetical protein
MSTTDDTRCMNHFGMVQPDVLSADCPLSGHAKLVYTCMTLNASGEKRDGIFPSIKTLAGRSSLSASTVKKALAELEQSGLIVAVKRHVAREQGIGRMPTEWRLRDTDDLIIRLYDDNLKWTGWQGDDEGVGRHTPYPLGATRPTPRSPDALPVGRETTTSSTSEQDQPIRTNQQDQKTTTDAPRIAAATRSTTVVTARVEPPKATMSRLDDIPDSWTRWIERNPDLRDPLDLYWAHLMATRYWNQRDDLNGVPATFHIEMEKGATVEMLAEGVEWLFGDGHCKYPHRQNAVMIFLANYCDSVAIGERKALTDASPGFRRGRMAAPEIASKAHKAKVAAQVPAEEIDPQKDAERQAEFRARIAAVKAATVPSESDLTNEHRTRLREKLDQVRAFERDLAERQAMWDRNPRKAEFIEMATSDLESVRAEYAKLQAEFGLIV